jgi:hypothetical protein
VGVLQKVHSFFLRYVSFSHEPYEGRTERGNILVENSQADSTNTRIASARSGTSPLCRQEVVQSVMSILKTHSLACPMAADPNAPESDRLGADETLLTIIHLIRRRRSSNLLGFVCSWLKIGWLFSAGGSRLWGSDRRGGCGSLRVLLGTGLRGLRGVGGGQGGLEGFTAGHGGGWGRGMD